MRLLLLILLAIIPASAMAQRVATPPTGYPVALLSKSEPRYTIVLSPDDTDCPATQSNWIYLVRTDGTGLNKSHVAHLCRGVVTHYSGTDLAILLDGLASGTLKLEGRTATLPPLRIASRYYPANYEDQKTLLAHLARQSRAGTPVAAGAVIPSSQNGFAPPTSTQITEVSDAYNIRHFGFVRGDAPGRLINRTLLGDLWTIRRFVQTPTCTRLAVRQYRCTYEVKSVTMLSQDGSLAAFAGGLVLRMQKPSQEWVKHSYVFTFDQGWKSEELERAVARAAAAFAALQRSQAVSASNSPTIGERFHNGVREATENFMEYPWKW
ncbi:MAG TPA: hypothetical protein VE053_03940 [Allosphingosinicella sp.]|nr:hypothetical protein [Allosphingosinicella sp.]